MKTLRETLKEAEEKRVAVGHFNISNLEGLWGIFRAARNLDLPVVIGVSEGERDFIGIKQARALVSSLRDEFNYPIYLNADHTYSFEGVKEVIDAGFDSVVVDGSALTYEENVRLTKQCVEYARQSGRDVLIEGEIGFIGKSSKLLDDIPDDVEVGQDFLTKPEEAKRFVEETGVDLLSPAVGSIHGMLKDRPDPSLDIQRIKLIREVVNVPLVLHGGSGTSDEDFTRAVNAGIAMVHINTELRVAYRDALRRSLQSDPDEIAPYKLLKEALGAMEKVTERRLKLFNHIQ